MAPKTIIGGDPIQILEETVLRLLKEGLYTFDEQVRRDSSFTLRLHHPRLKVSISRWNATITDQESFYTIYVTSKGSPEHRFYCGTEFTPIFDNITIRKAHEDSLRQEEQMKLARKREQDNAGEILKQAYG